MAVSMNLRLLLITLLTIAGMIGSPVQSQKAASTTSLTTTPTAKDTARSSSPFIVPKAVQESYSLPIDNIIVETSDEEDIVQKNSESDKIDLLLLSDESENNSNVENKFETRVDDGPPPRIETHFVKKSESPIEIISSWPVGVVDDYSDFENASKAYEDTFEQAPVEATTSKTITPSGYLAILLPASFESTTTTEKHTTTSSEYTKYVEKIKFNVSTTTSLTLENMGSENYTSSGTPSAYFLDGVVLMADNETDIDVPMNKNTSSMDLPPLTYWDQTSMFVQQLTNEHPEMCLIAIILLISILLLLLFLVSREFLKSRQHRRSLRHGQRYESVTADLYNTSSCSQYYTKPTVLPNDTEVTMQLITSDVSSEIC